MRSTPVQQRGIALALVLWVLALLTVMAMSITATQRTEVALTENLIANARFRAGTDAAIAYTVVSYLVPPEDSLGTADDADEPIGPWLPNGAPRQWRFAGQVLSIVVDNEQSRINLNAAEPDLLAALIGVFDVPEEEASALADAIADYRDEDDLTLLNGAEDGDYEAAGMMMGAKDAPFEAVEELQQVLGMSTELYLRLAPELTVDTGGGRPNEEFASAAVVAALQGVSLDEAVILVEERDDPLLRGAQGPRAVNRGGPLYRVRIASRGDPQRSGAAARVMEALVELTPGQTQPYRVRWRRFGLLDGQPPANPSHDTGDTEP